MIADPHEIQRLRYRDGQDLLSRDLADQAAFDAELRSWHNRAEHEAYGVRYGLRAVPVPGADPPEVEVGRGIAYDAAGRELMLPAPRRIPLPADPGRGEPVFLLLRYRAEAGGPSPSDLAAVCPGSCSGSLPGPRGADLAWVATRRPEGVPLARVRFVEGAPALDLSFQPPLARPLARPRLGRGSTVSGGTAWEIWDPGFRQIPLVGLQVSIDTHAAGFTQLPCYFAWLQGDLPVPFGDARIAIPFPLYPHLAEETLTGFRFRFMTLGFEDASQAAGSRAWIRSQARQRLSVCWLGIEMRGDGDFRFFQDRPEVIHGHS